MLINDHHSTIYWVPYEKAQLTNEASAPFYDVIINSPVSLDSIIADQSSA